MTIWRLHRSLTAQLILLSTAFILLAIGQFAFGWALQSASQADLVEETKRAVIMELYAALEKGPDALRGEARSAVIQKVARANPKFRYYAQSKDRLVSFGGEPRLIRHPELLRILENTMRESSGRVDASECSYSGGGDARLPFIENGLVGTILYSNCQGTQYMEVVGIENAAVSRADLLWSTMKVVSPQDFRDYALVSGGLLLITLFTFYRAWAHLRKAARLTDAVDFDQGNVQLSEAGLPLEVRPLVRAVNDMLRRIDESIERQRFFLATAAHELRTPLTILRARLEEIPESDTKTSIRNDVKRMSGLVDEMLTLMKLKSGTRVQYSEVNLVQIARDVCAARAPIAIDRGVELEFDARAITVPVQGDAPMISTAISNVLDNAISVSSCGDTVSISIDIDGCVAVRDHGPGLPGETDASIFEPFSKFPSNRKGHGLGLAIVAEIMSLHDGCAEANNAPDGGAIFCLRFDSTLPRRGGPANSNGKSRSVKWDSAVQAASASGSDSKYPA